jgi:SPOR domain
MADRYQDRPFPADEYGRGGNQASSRGESDPLAELARLIGQTDPFAGMGRANARPRADARDPFQPAPQQAPPQQPVQQPPQQPQFAPQPQFAQPPQFAQQPPLAQPPLPPQPVPQPQQPQPQQLQQPAVPEAGDGLAGPPSWMRSAAQQSPQDLDSIRQPAPPRYAAAATAEPSFQPAPAFAPTVDPRERMAGPTERYDDALYGQLPGGERGNLPQDQGFDDPYAYQDEYDDGGDLEQRPRGRGMFTVGVLLTLAVVGTGGAFAYRSMFGSSNSSEPPIIRADNGPNKMMIPPMQSGDNSGKLIQDRLANGGTEKMVSREEQPMDLRDGRPSPRVIFPPLNQNGNPPPAASAPPLNRPMAANTGNTTSNAASMASMSGNINGTSNSAMNGGMGGDEPRKIHTLSVKGGDQPDPAAAASPPPMVRPVAAQAMRTAAATRNPPAAVGSAAAPMSIAPAAAAEPRTRAASINTPQPVTAAATGGGAYMIQVTSQPSESDAQKTYKVLQGKYPDQLGSREPMIKRVDLGDKGGIKYRTMVGPFDSSDEANQFCAGLKTAGGQCFLQRN